MTSMFEAHVKCRCFVCSCVLHIMYQQSLQVIFSRIPTVRGEASGFGSTMASSGGYHLLANAMRAYELNDELIDALCKLVGGDLCAVLQKGSCSSF